MNFLANVYVRRAGWAVAAFCIALAVSLWIIRSTEAGSKQIFTDGELMIRLFLIPFTIAAFVLTILSTLVSSRASAAPPVPSPTVSKEVRPFMAQVVGVQWLNPLQRMDYPTEWQLLWTLGLAKHNQDDDLVKEDPQEYARVKAIASVAMGDKGKMPFEDYHRQYLSQLIYLYRDIYFSNSKYFYNAHSLKDKSTRRELAGIRVEYALPREVLINSAARVPAGAAT